MKKLKVLYLDTNEVLTRKQLKNVLGGNGSGAACNGLASITVCALNGTKVGTIPTNDCIPGPSIPPCVQAYGFGAYATACAC